MNDTTQMPQLETVEVTTGTAISASVIWLHGLGADGHDFEPIVPELHLPESLGVRFVFPHAPIRPVTINAGQVMRAWFDITALSLDAKLDFLGVRSAISAVHHLIEKEHQRGIPYHRIVLAGFSQGGTIALYAGLTAPQRLAGILALSTFFPPTPEMQPALAGADRTIPIMQTHGLRDEVLPMLMGQASRTFLESAGFRVDWHSYDMGHAVCPAEIRDISVWLQQVLL